MSVRLVSSGCRLALCFVPLARSLASSTSASCLVPFFLSFFLSVFLLSFFASSFLLSFFLSFFLCVVVLGCFFVPSKQPFFCFWLFYFSFPSKVAPESRKQEAERKRKKNEKVRRALKKEFALWWWWCFDHRSRAMADPPRRELGEVAAGRDPHAGEGGTVAAAVGRHERRGEEGRGGGQRAAERSSLMLSRTLRVLDRDANAQPRGGNRVTSTRFTWWNFVFLFLYEQFDPRHKFANFYFLVICVLQSLDSISITNGYPVCLNALAFVVLVQFVLTLKETISRCSNDRSTNSRPVSLYDTESNELKPGTWGDVLVGDIVKVTQGSFFPADLVLIATSPSASDDAVASSLGGCCFINTQNLDGETNHKIRKTPQVPLSVVADTGYGDDQDGGADRSDEHANGVAEAMEVAIRTWEDAELRCEAYNSRTTEFTATARFSTTSQSAASETVPLSIENLLLRGCVLVDAEWVLGIAVAVGGTAKCNFREEDGDASAKSCCPQVGGRKGKDSMKVVSVGAVRRLPKRLSQATRNAKKTTKSAPCCIVMFGYRHRCMLSSTGKLRGSL